MKSCGRAPTFLSMTGYDQVRSAAAVAGDLESADNVELTLPETGVCGGAGLVDDTSGQASGGCCTPTPALVQIGVGAAPALTIGDADQASGGCCG
jgi:hypothetical protein